MRSSGLLVLKQPSLLGRSWSSLARFPLGTLRHPALALPLVGGLVPGKTSTPGLGGLGRPRWPIRASLQRGLSTFAGAVKARHLSTATTRLLTKHRHGPKGRMLAGRHRGAQPTGPAALPARPGKGCTGRPSPQWTGRGSTLPRARQPGWSVTCFFRKPEPRRLLRQQALQRQFGTATERAEDILALEALRGGF